MRGAALGLLCVHFAGVLIYVLPVNPLLLKSQVVIERVTSRYFGQVWTLFGPEPLTSNDVLLVRPLTDDEVRAIPGRGLPTTGWQDLSTSLWLEFQANRLSMYDRAYRPQMNGMLSYLSGDSDLAAWQMAAWQKNDTEAVQTYQKLLGQERADATTLLVRIASSFLNQTCPRPDIRQMALQIRVEKPLPWSKRDETDRPVRYIQVGVFPIDRTVYPATFYRPAPPAVATAAGSVP